MEDVLTSTKIGYGDCTLGLLAPYEKSGLVRAWIRQSHSLCGVDKASAKVVNNHCVHDCFPCP